ncbi:pantoate--beta-alanine ligase [Oceanimonas baumannii]|uniref:Pantothenate synthetase n=1 Tax=Oceanimonas baumannii TaxID=129578 RepID=A0A235CBU2_9GAMM|nr:pantoate--beta-alanine ligase [Oceanimonas baumannii]OYD21275.1 pantoate--beta-alanine ligase [Oceanimonas baumannii]TDW55342.1 pantoate--beta-alanine ligase [Oceanimonas baumannii]
MHLVSTIEQLRAIITDWRRAGLRIGFVPTMGNLHDGHLELVRRAREQADRVVVSIFVNPLQFDRAADLDAYPRTLEQDCAHLGELAELVFTPTPALMYPNGQQQQTRVSVPGVSEVLEGALRPGHFDGVSTVVCKLFNLVQPDLACFGEKDYQQLALIRKMTADLNLPVDIVGVPTVRAGDGLALSSRNGYLTGAERALAPELAATMGWLAERMAAGERNLAQLVADGRERLNNAGFRTDGIDIVDAGTLTPLTGDSRAAVILMAAFLGKARLIDNQVVQLG